MCAAARHHTSPKSRKMRKWFPDQGMIGNQNGEKQKNGLGEIGESTPQDLHGNLGTDMVEFWMYEIQKESQDSNFIKLCRKAAQ